LGSGSPRPPGMRNQERTYFIRAFQQGARKPQRVETKRKNK
jgi:hypothetical protein